MLTELLVGGSDTVVQKCTVYHRLMHALKSSELARCAHCLVTFGEASQVVLCRARSRSRYGWLELWADVRARYKRGIKLRVRTRKKDKQGTGAKQRTAKLGPGPLHVVVILGRSKRARSCVMQSWCGSN